MLDSQFTLIYHELFITSYRKLELFLGGVFLNCNAKIDIKKTNLVSAFFRKVMPKI